MLDQFHRHVLLTRKFTSYSVTLIPMINSPTQLSYFMFISLVGYLYKLVAKVLTTRLNEVMEGKMMIREKIKGKAGII